ncbi:hypothetical protein HJ01_01681 [Flavobacterium frigoris PS1]|uniref:Uncharacterized protein n=1 Tax=Flavobacterium frigoris (strain PS1) TaxID=1086011 RepID=H7FRD2_FLAFP|nr:hypothetical protein HJ01_01681 [Flavobacterium frigoris PS1]
MIKKLFEKKYIHIIDYQYFIIKFNIPYLKKITIINFK